MVKNIALVWLKVFIHLAASLPIIWLYYHAVIDDLGADPVEYVIHFTGIGALNMLLITLLVSPTAQRYKWANLMKTRRLLGLYSATYAFLHLLNFIVFEIQFDLSLLIGEIIERPYITIGMLAFVIMLLLSITSLDLLKRKMGKSWQTLHKGIYVMAVLIGVHFYWSVKSEIIEPSLYLLMIFILLMVRTQRIKQWLKPTTRSR